MAYCTHVELTALTGTTLSTDVQGAIIDQSDREIDARLQAESLTPPASDDSLKAASLNLSKVGIITHNRMTGTQTKSVKVGDITIQDDLDTAIEALTAKAWQSVGTYITQNTAAPIPPGLAVGDRRGQEAAY